MSIPNSLVFLVLVLLAGLTTACSSSDDDMTSAVGANSALIGMWESNCAFDANLVGYTTDLYEINNGSFSLLSGNYSDSGCTAQSTESRSQGTYTEAGTSTLSTGDVVTLLDFTIQTTTSTPTSEASVNILNESQICGISTWSLNVSVDISNCQELVESGLPSNFYNIYAIENNTLFLGKTDETQNGETPAMRPTTLNRLRPFTRTSN